MFIEKSGITPVSEWIRSFAAGIVAEEKRKVPKVDPAFLRQIAGIGNNLNQIARVVNTKKNAVEKAWLLSQLASVEDALRDLREDVESDSHISQ